MPEPSYHSLEDVHSSVDTVNQKSKWKRLFAFLGPAYLISVGYMDPGNWATDLAAGSHYNYTLIWVLLLSNLMAVLLQYLSAKLGVVRKRDLAQASRETYPPFVNFILYLLAEIAIAATDLAEVLGMAIGLNLLFGLPLLWAVAITILDTFLLLLFQRLGMRKMEAFIIALIGVIGFSFLINLVIAAPDVSEIVTGFVPYLPDSYALYIAIGIIGATVMPHNLYLHSALVQTRKIDGTKEGIRKATVFNLFDSAIALNLAFFVNAAIMILAASTFYANGYFEIGGIEEAYKLLEPLLGTTLAPVLFAVALIAAGQSSTITSTLAGQVVMEGYLHLRIQPWLRRLITRLLAIIPAFIAIYISGSGATTELLILSQVILSLQLGFATIPLIHFVSDRKKMGEDVIGTWVKTLAWISAAIIVVLNAKLVWDELAAWIERVDMWAIQAPVLILTGGAAVLLVYIVAFPWLNEKKQEAKDSHLHSAIKEIASLPRKPMAYNLIVIPVDFSEKDAKAIERAVSVGGPDSRYLLVHVVESAGARLFGREIFDYESEYDQRQLETYERQLTDKGFRVSSVLGYGSPKKVITQIVTERNADLLVMGAHGHRTIKDIIFGQTVHYVRHSVDIPVLIT